MDDKLFSELLASTKEAKEILAKKTISAFKDENEEREGCNLKNTKPSFPL